MGHHHLPPLQLLKKIFNDPNGLTTDVTNEVTTIEDNEIWKQWGLPISDPLKNSNFASDITSSFTDLSNKDIWSKTYYGSLNNISVNTDYQRGDNIFFEGKHYVYVSNLPSSDESLGGNDGVNDFQQLLSNGAIKELGVYVDTVGAGGSKSKSKDSFYAANQDLEFLDRLPNSGEVRTNGVQPRGSNAKR